MASLSRLVDFFIVVLVCHFFTQDPFCLLLLDAVQNENEPTTCCMEIVCDGMQGLSQVRPPHLRLKFLCMMI